MPRYKLTIAYDGTDFCGWQKQDQPDPDAPPPAPGEDKARVVLRTVQGVVEDAVRDAAREPVTLIGASRTDSGVHARGQVGAFTASGADGKGTGWPEDRGVDALRKAINSRLPDDVLVTNAELTSDDFDPISMPVSKGYTYTLHTAPDRPVFGRRFVHHLWTPIDAAPMRDAAALLEGEHDFASFAAVNHGRQTTVRTVHECKVEAIGDDRVAIHVSGSGFLYNMVRIIAGTLVEVGRGRMTGDDVRRALAEPDRRNAGPTLPPTGLCLEWIRYPD